MGEAKRCIGESGFSWRINAFEKLAEDSSVTSTVTVGWHMLEQGRPWR